MPNARRRPSHLPFPDDLMLPVVLSGGYRQHIRASQLKWHVHGGYMLQFVLRGQRAWDYVGLARPITVHGGQFFILQPRHRHQPHAATVVPSTEFYFELARPTRWTNLAGTVFTPGLYRAMCRAFESNGGICYAANRQLAAHLHQVEKLLQSQSPDSPDQTARLRALLCQIVLETYASLGQQPVREDSLVNAAQEYLTQHLHEPISMDQVAAHLGIHVSWFQKQFRRRKGVPPNEFLQRLRIERAMELLRDPKQSLVQIALGCGFQTAQYFSHVFKRHTGKTPGQFRREASKSGILR